MNTKKDKIELLKAILSGEIKPEQITRESVLISDGKEAFTGLMIGVANHKAGKQSPVIYVGEAKKLIEQTMEKLNVEKC
jgi:hypothetical protein